MMSIATKSIDHNSNKRFALFTWSSPAYDLWPRSRSFENLTILPILLHWISSITAVRRHCTDWYEIWALTDHEIYYIKIELDLRKFSNGPFSETEKAFWVNPTPGGSQCTGLSPTLSWKWPRATLSPSFGPFFERNHFFGVKMVSGNFWKTFKSCPLAWNPTGKKQIYMNFSLYIF